MVMVSARREKCRFGSISLRHLEAEHITIKCNRTLKVRNFEMHVTYTRLRMNGTLIFFHKAN
jgi:hypothetical protein